MRALQEQHDRNVRMADSDRAGIVAVLSSSGILLEAAGLDEITREEAIGRPFCDGPWWRGKPEVQHLLRDAVSRAAKGEPIHQDLEVRASNGPPARLEYACRPVKNERGETTMLLFEARQAGRPVESAATLEYPASKPADQDHSVRQESPQSDPWHLLRLLELRTNQFETLLRRAPLGILLIDADLRIRHLNPAAEAAFGGLARGVAGRRLEEVLYQILERNSADELMSYYRHTLETGEPCVVPEREEYRLDRTTTEHHEFRLDRIPMPDGRLGVVCYFRDISKDVRSREEILRSEERFRAFVTASSDVVYRMSPDWKEMRSLQGRDFIPDTRSPDWSWVEKYIYAGDRDMVLSTIQRAIRTQSPFELEHRVIRVDGSIGWTVSRAIPLTDSEGNITEWFGAARDVTESKLAEQALVRLTAESEQQRRLYQTILSSTPDLVYVFDLQHRFTYANEALLTMWGKTAEEALGKNCLELGYEPWHAAMHDREIEQVIATKQPIRGDVPFSGTHGRRIYDYIFVPVIGANGDVEAIAGTTRDVTDRKLVEETVRDREERLRFMAESMPQKIFTAKPNGQVDYFNQQWMEFASPGFEDIYHWSWKQLVHPDDCEGTIGAWRHAVETGEPFQFTHRFLRRDGVYRWHLSRARAMRAVDGRVTMWIGSSTEIHEQKRTEEELRQANQDLEQFAYAATHDLQEPLRSVKIYGDLLAQRYTSRLDGQALEFLAYIRSGASRMEMLVRDLLAYTRAGLGAPAEITDANECVRSAMANLAGAIGESGAQIAVDPLPSVNIHGLHLQQVFQNLISNAIKYRRLELLTAIHVTAHREKEYWHFTIADNGIGIEPEYKEQIFGLFKRLHTSDQYSGTGIGLALCQRIVERNHGRIWVESEVGKGSRFHFTLPA